MSPQDCAQNVPFLAFIVAKMKGVQDRGAVTFIRKDIKTTDRPDLTISSRDEVLVLRPARADCRVGGLYLHQIWLATKHFHCSQVKHTMIVGTDPDKSRKMRALYFRNEAMSGSIRQRGANTLEDR